MTVVQVAREFRELPIASIDEPVLPSRSAMDDTKMDELVASIRANGLIQPITVARVGERYEVICGHRRRVASARAGLVTMPCIVYPSKDARLLALQAHENSRREDLNPADEALWFSDLLEQQCGGDIEQLCGLVNEKLSYVDNRLALFRGDPVVFAALQAGDIKIGVAHELNRLPDAQYRNYYLQQAIKNGATVAVVTGWVTDWKNMFTGLPASAPAPAAAAPIVPGPSYDPHRCYICGQSDHRFIPESIAVHTHCKLALLDPMLAASRGQE
jgi:ParB family chromosome partitioning protein